MEVEKAIGKMKSGKAGGNWWVKSFSWSDRSEENNRNLQYDCGGGKYTERLVEEENIPKGWELNTLLPIYKGKTDPKNLGNIRL